MSNKTGNTVIPGCARSGAGPESITPARGYGFRARAQEAAPRNDGSGGDGADWLRLRDLLLAKQFGPDWAVQRLFQAGQRSRDRGRVGDAVVPADHDVDGVVRPYRTVAHNERPRTERMKLAGPERRHRGDAEGAEIIGALAAEMQSGHPDQPAQRQRQPRRAQDLPERRHLVDRGGLRVADQRVDLA